MSVAVIPSRVGSKSVPGKNTRVVAGIKLWQWSLLAAAQSKSIQRIIVASDDESILLDGHDNGCEIVSLPDALTTDTASLDESILYAIDQKEVADETLIVVLQPTVPVRRDLLIDECVGCIRTFEDAKSLITVNPLHFVWNPAGKQINPPRAIRQEMSSERLFHEDGSVFVVGAKDYREHRARVIEPVVLYEAPRTVDIDTEEDLEIAEFLLQRQKIA